MSLGDSASGQQESLQDRLTAEGSAKLAEAARREGDAKRGAVVFHQPFLACTKCHSVGQASNTPTLGPDLTRPEKGTTAESLVESVLDPSKILRKGFETIVVQQTDGKTVTGLLIEENADAIILRDAGRIGETVTIPKSQIDERVLGKTSIMPAGQVNVLSSRQQFLDLVRYLIEISEGGSERARQLQPPASLFAFVLPEYESHIDHAGLIGDLDEKSFKRGEEIYLWLCVNCHGTKDQPGSLPTSLKFAQGKFKNGHDPHRMYQTVTHGFGLMAPQTWMVPQQKYDVIHYIREKYLKPHNPSQYANVDAAYLASLPKGDTRGPAPSNIQAWSSMNYGPFLTATYEVGSSGLNIAQKGIAVRLDSGPGGVARGKYWQLFDHDTLRLAGAWSAMPGDTTNFIDWHGINFDGRHQIHPHAVGQIHFGNPTGPGWAKPGTSAFDDPRILGRDEKHYGPLPKSWGRYRGLYQYGDQVILSYIVGQTEVLEMPGVVSLEHTTGPGDKKPDQNPEESLFTRTFQIGPRPEGMLLKVATHQSSDPVFKLLDVKPSDGAKEELVAVLEPKKSRTKKSGSTTFDGQFSMDIEKSQDFDLTGHDYTIAARIKTSVGGSILCQAPVAGPWEPNGKSLFVRDDRLTFDIGWVGVVAGKTKITDDRWHDVAMTWKQKSGQVRLFVDGTLDGQGILKPMAKAERQTMRIGFTSPDFPDPTFFNGQISEVRFFQMILSDDEIANALQSKNEHLLAAWKLDSAAEGLIRDETGLGHTAKISGGPGALKNNPLEFQIAAGVSAMPAGAKWVHGDGNSLLLSLPAGRDPLKFVVSVAASSSNSQDVFAALVSQPPLDLSSLIKGGPRRWLDELKTELIVGPGNGPFAADLLTLPANNPWFAQLRLTGFDFFADGDRMAVCTWDGDVWQVSGLLDKRADRSTPQQLTWRRIANGLFQPLGLKIIKERIYVTCRDQLAILNDLNGDGETDFIECFNNDHQVTEHFHEFAMGLQTDDEGNFYYAKSARHALPAVVPHHGTLLKITADGSRTEILANGFRAANGVCLNPDGSFVVTDQEGHWNPKNRINWVTPAKPGEKPRFYGNMFGYHDVTDASDRAMEPPLCWITNEFDRSPAELLWVTSNKWGPLKGSLLNLSYGYGKLFVVPFEKLAPTPSSSKIPAVRVQGGMCELPIPAFPTGVMRGRFHPTDGALYTCGMFAWAGNATQPGGFYRIRATGKPMNLPVGLKAAKRRLEITFSDPLSTTPPPPDRFNIRTWSLKRTADYGSKHYNEKSLSIASTRLSKDHRTVSLELPEIQPTWCMAVEYKLTGASGEPVNGLIHNTIHWVE